MRIKIVINFVLIFILFGSLLYAQGYGRGRGVGNAANFENICVQMPQQEIDENEKSALVYMREEEKLAHDVYLSLYNKWNLPIFQNIAQSEERHTESIRLFLDKYNIQDPVTDESIGVFTNAELQKLYNDLVTKGQKSLLAALTVGATIEDVDIFDLNNSLQKTDNDDLACLFNNLVRGSENHMRSFYRLLERNGGSYEAQYLSQQELDTILQAESSRGRGRGKRGKR